MNYYISDLHLLHKNCIRFDERPFEDLEEMHETILANWNRKVTDSDTVYILGDAAMYGKKEKAIELIAGMKGKKVLVRGNHDYFHDEQYLQLYEEICDYKEIEDTADGTQYRLVLFHYPIFSWKNMGHGTILLYGHTHNSMEDDYYQTCLAKMAEEECSRHIYECRPQAYNVGCMKPWMNYEPRSLEEILNWEQNNNQSDGVGN